MALSPDSDRRFGFELLLATVLIIGCVAGLAFLRSTRGYLWLADGASIQRLVPAGTGEAGQSVVFPASHPRTSGRRLGTVELDSRSRYLLASELGPGQPLVLAAENRPLEARMRFNCAARIASSTCLRVLDPRELPPDVELRAWYRGMVPRELYGLTVARLSSLHSWLVTLLRAALWLVPLGFLIRHRRRLAGQLGSLEARDDPVFALLVFGLCFVVFHAAPVQQVQDGRYLTAVSHSILRGEGVELPANFGPGQRDRLPYQIDRINGRLLHHFSPMPALLDAPVVAAYAWFGITPISPDGAGWDFALEKRIQRFSAALVASLLCVVLYFTARKLLPPLHSLGLTVAFAFGTQVFSTLSRPYWSHTWSALLAALAIYLVVCPSRRRTAVYTTLAATSTAWSVFVRPQYFSTAIGLVLLLMIARRWRQLGIFIGVGIAWSLD